VIKNSTSNFGCSEIAPPAKPAPESYPSGSRGLPFYFSFSLCDSRRAYKPSSGLTQFLKTCADRLDIEKIMAQLPPRSQEVFKQLLDGKTNPEIEKNLDFQTNGAVRWQKNQIKQVYHTVVDRVYNEYVCRTCANVYKDISPLECPKCGSRDLYKVSLY